MIVALVLISSFFIRRWRRALRVAAGVLLYFFCNDFIANEVMTAWEVEETPWSTMNKTYEWGIVLTGVTRLDTEPRDRVHFARGADRVVHTVQLYKKGIIKNVLISGGSGRLIRNEVREADELYEVFVLLGVDSAHLRVENESRNTAESARAVPHLLPGVTPRDCLLITSAFHMRRSLACFAKQGWPMDAFSTDKRTHRRLFKPDVLFIPSYEAIGLWQSLLKEWTGMLAYKLAGYI
ncbi:MAG: YdcF family protein [Cyclobacteriaceae bacterium]|nr:YdcF family protein [Cyclobacteriaceae bacterium]